MDAGNGNYKNGAVGQYIENHADHGQGLWMRQIHGSKGSMDMPHDRSGKILKLTLDRTNHIEDGSILDLVPDWMRRRRRSLVANACGNMTSPLSRPIAS
jgi:hypothetical protein